MGTSRCTASGEQHHEGKAPQAGHQTSTTSTLARRRWNGATGMKPRARHHVAQRLVHETPCSAAVAVLLSASHPACIAYDVPKQKTNLVNVFLKTNHDLINLRLNAVFQQSINLVNTKTMFNKFKLPPLQTNNLHMQKQLRAWHSRRVTAGTAPRALHTGHCATMGMAPRAQRHGRRTLHGTAGTAAWTRHCWHSTSGIWHHEHGTAGTDGHNNMCSPPRALHHGHGTKGTLRAQQHKHRHMAQHHVHSTFSWHCGHAQRHGAWLHKHGSTTHGTGCARHHAHTAPRTRHQGRSIRARRRTSPRRQPPARHHGHNTARACTARALHHRHQLGQHGPHVRHGTHGVRALRARHHAWAQHHVDGAGGMAAGGAQRQGARCYRGPCASGATPWERHRGHDTAPGAQHQSTAPQAQHHGQRNNT